MDFGSTMVANWKLILYAGVSPVTKGLKFPEKNGNQPPHKRGVAT